MRLKSFPVAFKMLEKRGQLEEIPFMRQLNGRTTLCQLITLVRNFDWTLGAVAEDFISPACPAIIGLADTLGLFKDSTFRSIVWVKTRADGKRYEKSIPRIPMGKYEAVAMAPLGLQSLRTGHGAHIRQSRTDDALHQLPPVRRLRSDAVLLLGVTALMVAAQWNRPRIVSFLLSKGADVDAQENASGCNALMFACLSGNPEVVRLVLKHGAPVNSTNFNGRTPPDNSGFLRYRQGGEDDAETRGRH